MSVTPSHLVWVPWHTKDRPEWGWRSLTFPLTVHDGPWRRSYYHAFSFWFAGTNRTEQGYTGLLAWDKIQYAKFSCFGEGVTNLDSVNCWNGADGGPGCSCEIEIPHVKGREYLYTVENDSITRAYGGDERVWHGWCTDAVTLEQRRIGSWAVPKGWNGLDSNWVAFHEIYISQQSCADTPFTRVTFGEPYSVADNTHGWLADPYESPMSRCKGTCGFKWWREPSEQGSGAVTIETGFRKRDRPDPELCPCAQVNVDVEVNVDVSSRRLISA